MLAKALARSIDCSVRRIQFTPDLLPSDVTGVSVYNQKTRDFEFKPGPSSPTSCVGDEINRASPKTQSALLECMEERQVTVDGTTYPLEPPFMVIATQNPIEMEGTYPLPEAQRDRFTARISMGYPDRGRRDRDARRARRRDRRSTTCEPVADAGEIAELIGAVRRVHVAEEVRRYAVDLVTATRRTPELRLGASPRADPAPAAGRPRPAPRSTAATSSCPTTCRPWPARCSRTGCCSRAEARWPAAARAGRGRRSWKAIARRQIASRP